MVASASLGGTSLPEAPYEAGSEELVRVDWRDEALDVVDEADDDMVERRLRMDGLQGEDENEAVEEREAEDNEAVEEDE